MLLNDFLKASNPYICKDKFIVNFLANKLLIEKGIYIIVIICDANNLNNYGNSNILFFVYFYNYKIITIFR